MEIAKIVVGGILGIAVAAVILKFGLKDGWFGGAGEEEAAVSNGNRSTESQADGRSFTSLPPSRPPQQKHPPPSAEARAALQSEIDGAFADRLSAELPDQQKRGLARRLVQLADDARDRPDERFMLLTKAGELHVDAGDLPAMNAIVAALGAEYEISRHELTETWLQRFAEAADQPHEIDSLVAHAKMAIDQALVEDRYDDALALAEATVAACRRPAGEKHRESVEQGRERIARLRDSWPAYEEARQTLKSSPDDPQANFLVGRWLCLEKDAWNGGLLYLAKGGDHPLAEAARQDRAVAAGPASPEKSVELADRWFDLAMADEANRACLGRAFHWYRSAQGALSGEDVAHVEARLDVIFREAATRGLIPETTQ